MVHIPWKREFKHVPVFRKTLLAGEGYRQDGSHRRDPPRNRQNQKSRQNRRGRGGSRVRPPPRILDLGSSSTSHCPSEVRRHVPDLRPGIASHCPSTEETRIRSHPELAASPDTARAGFEIPQAGPTSMYLLRPAMHTEYYNVDAC